MNTCCENPSKNNLQKVKNAPISMVCGYLQRLFEYCRNLTSPWGNEDTQTLIDILAKYNVKTTFFVVGEWVDKYPDSVKALHDAGHEIMNHSKDHAHYNSLSTEEIIADVNACNDKIEAITGVRPTLIRCPYGEYDDHVVTAIRSIGMEPIQWDVELLETDETRCSARDTWIFRVRKAHDK